MQKKKKKKKKKGSHMTRDVRCIINFQGVFYIDKNHNIYLFE
jgi:hypothetical protein